MVPDDPTADDYRARAAGLRRLAARLDDAPLHTLDRWAGIETWSSSRSRDCLLLLRDDQLRWRQQADELRARAWQFERLADAVDAAATARRLAQVP